LTNYEVGQIIFVLNARKMSIAPVQVVEQLVKRTRAGEQISYMVSSTATEHPQQLEELHGDVYTTLNEVRDVMKKNANAAIDKMIVNAQEQIQVLDPYYQDKKLNSEKSVPVSMNETEETMITLPDGTVARLKNSSNIL